MTRPAFGRILGIGIVVLATVTGALSAAAQGERAESADLIRRRAELQEAVARFGDNAPGLLSPLSRLGYALLDDGRPAEAERVFRRQLAIGMARFPDRVETAHPLHHLGETYRRTRRCAEALPLYRQALAIRERRIGPDHGDIARSLTVIGLCQMELTRFAEAEDVLKRALAMRERLSGDESAEAATVANDLGDLYARTGRNAEAIAVLRRAAASREQLFGGADSRLLSPLARLGYALLEDSQYDNAEQVFRRQIAIAETRFPPGHAERAFPLYNLGEAYRRRGDCVQAEPLLMQSLELRERLFGPVHDQVARSLIGLAQCFGATARFAEAERDFRRALEILEATRGTDSLDVSSAALTFAQFYNSALRFAEAEPLLLRALAIRERQYGPDDLRLPAVLNGLTRIYRSTDRYREAEATARRSLSIRETVYGAEHEFTAGSVQELGSLYMLMGRYAESEQLKRRALSTFERVFGPEHRSTGEALASLAETYYQQGRFAEAVELFQRAVGVLENSAGTGHPILTFPLRMLGLSYRRAGQVEAGLPHLVRSLAVSEAAYGADSRRVAQAANALARSYIDIGRHEEAEALLHRSLAIHEKTVGADSTLAAYDRLNLARTMNARSRFGEAEALAQRAVDNLVRVRGAEDFQAAWGRTVLGEALEKQDRLEPALAQLRLATAAFQEQMDRASGERSGAGLTEQTSYRSAFMDHAFLLWRAQNADAARRRDLTAEAFTVVQLAQATGTESAVARMAARFASGTDALARLIRSREDALELWRSKDATLLQLVGRPRAERDAGQEAKLRAEVEALDTRLTQLDERIAREFPQYASLATPRPVPLSEIQALLRPDEAMVLWLAGSRRSLIMAVRRDRTLFARVDVPRAELNQAVRDLRKGLDPSEVTSLSDIPPFDTTKAHLLYNSIFAPIAPALDGARHVFLVPDAGLQSLPLGVLVTAPPSGPITEMKGYREVNWLASRYATTVLPSVGSLKSLRRFARTARASAPFLGIGDPLLEGHPGATRGVNLARLYSRGAVADADEVRKLPPLPDTADELTAMARTLGAQNGDLYLGPRATEAQVRGVDFRRYRVVAFATHGLMAGEFSDIGEPALVLTPPARATPDNDGLLTASEIAGLQLDADWVILSACNTAAADGAPGAEGLSGLARAFFYAGSRALLVSHWAVLSDAAVKLTTRMLRESSADPALPRSEAHRRAMLALAADAENPHYAHPMFWAPFVVVGEGGPSRLP